MVALAHEWLSDREPASTSGPNMLALFFIGRGMGKVGLVYFVSLAAGSLCVTILEPGSLSLGASAAIFGLNGAPRS